MRLRPGPFAILIALNAVLWFLAALLICALEPIGALQGRGTVVFYVLLIPGTVPFIWLTRKAAKLRHDQTALGVTIATAAAVLLDGIALMVIPWLYGPNTAGAGPAILWGAGVALSLGVAMNRLGGR